MKKKVNKNMKVKMEVKIKMRTTTMMMTTVINQNLLKRPKRKQKAMKRWETHQLKNQNANNNEFV